MGGGGKQPWRGLIELFSSLRAAGTQYGLSRVGIMVSKLYTDGLEGIMASRHRNLIGPLGT